MHRRRYPLAAGKSRLLQVWRQLEFHRAPVSARTVAAGKRGAVSARVGDQPIPAGVSLGPALIDSPARISWSESVVRRNRPFAEPRLPGPTSRTGNRRSRENPGLSGGEIRLVGAGPGARRRGLLYDKARFSSPPAGYMRRDFRAD